MGSSGGNQTTVEQRKVSSGFQTHAIMTVWKTQDNTGIILYFPYSNMLLLLLPCLWYCAQKTFVLPKDPKILYIVFQYTFHCQIYININLWNKFNKVNKSDFQNQNDTFFSSSKWVFHRVVKRKLHPSPERLKITKLGMHGFLLAVMIVFKKESNFLKPLVLCGFF